MQPLRQRLAEGGAGRFEVGVEGEGQAVDGFFAHLDPVMAL